MIANSEFSATERKTEDSWNREIKQSKTIRDRNK